ncbi:DUF1127 domain-containing protein [Notoacmeibacter sp. MSK16QG-6]|uniref:DUF1127 domain-containing protein n=1 Tax=Notoacmeibacter sp. MSK16QG-6 TaxID=2957982 RepID=UPI0020A0DBF5|nr:DUF1127 domain-containing protein [Notoacmeibacter sp. MSK16QG-6]MCP1199453.1 DUF1127 domain-containing protein [Notoacmeibacter sp. MSK16QG-6]
MAIMTILRGSSDQGAMPVQRATSRFDPRWLHPYALIAIYTTYAAKRRSRRALSRLSNDQLLDIGVTRDQAMREAERVLWRGDWYQ